MQNASHENMGNRHKNETFRTCREKRKKKLAVTRRAWNNAMRIQPTLLGNSRQSIQVKGHEKIHRKGKETFRFLSKRNLSNTCVSAAAIPRPFLVSHPSIVANHTQQSNWQGQSARAQKITKQYIVIAAVASVLRISIAAATLLNNQIFRDTLYSNAYKQ